MFDKDAQFHKCTDGHVKPYPSLLCSRCMAEGVNFNAFDEYKKLQAELDKHRWIPVSERLPVFEEGATQSPWIDVTDGKRVIQAYYYDYTKRKAVSNSATGKGWYCPGMGQEDITHWKSIILP